MQLAGGGVAESKNYFVEVFVELLCVRQDGKIVPLFGRGRRDMEMALAAKNRSRNFAVDLAVECDTAAVKSKCSGIALEHEILDSDDLTGWEQTAQLLIVPVGVGRALRGKRADADRGNQKKDKIRRTNTKVH